MRHGLLYEDKAIMEGKVFSIHQNNSIYTSSKYRAHECENALDERSPDSCKCPQSSQLQKMATTRTVSTGGQRSSIFQLPRCVCSLALLLTPARQPDPGLCTPFLDPTSFWFPAKKSIWYQPEHCLPVLPPPARPQFPYLYDGHS